jgi:hypothetical protein
MMRLFRESTLIIIINKIYQYLVDQKFMAITLMICKLTFRYIYTDEITITNDNVFILLFCAVQYEISKLENLCADFLDQLMKPEHWLASPRNVCLFMNEAVEFKSVALQEKCCSYFSEYTRYVMGDISFLQLSQPALSAFLDVEPLNVPEIVIFEHVKRWMEHNCKKELNGENMREAIGDALYKLRFPTMNVHDFANGVSTIKGLLTDTEKAQVFQKITIFDNEDIECPFPSKFRGGYQFGWHDALIRHLCEEMTIDGENYMESESEGIQSDGDCEYRTDYHIILQCCADLANSRWTGVSRNAANLNARKQMFKDFNPLKDFLADRKPCDRMNKFMEFRSKLGKISKWPW